MLNKSTIHLTIKVPDVKNCVANYLMKYLMINTISTVFYPQDIIHHTISGGKERLACSRQNPTVPI